MKRYLLFGGETYYARGGVHDLQGAFAYQSLAIVAGRMLTTDWWHVYDTKERKIIAGSQYQAHDAPELTAEQVGE